jgi:imidazoleglycerol-phosphate dehydratase/histidinol-phosphatase
MKQLLFVDRDGTLIQEPADFQIDNVEKFHLLPGVIPALNRFVSAGFELIMVTNQDGLGTSTYPQEKFDLIQNLLLDILATQGIYFKNILICPHKPEEGCRCRKPQTQLVREYLASNDMDRENSFVIGDRTTDLELAENMGLSGILISDEFNWTTIAHKILDRPRAAQLRRDTNETKIFVHVELDAEGPQKIATGIGFFDHMLEQLSRHGGFALQLEAKGDIHIDDHHLVEDTALALGATLRKALGNKRGIGRYGFWLPMDEADCRVTLDLSGRAEVQISADLGVSRVGELNAEMIPHFFKSLADSLAMSIHIETRGQNSHHMVESMFKAVGRALRPALAKGNTAEIPSTKGTL